MKKIVLWFMSTLTALVLLFGYHTSTSSSATAAGGGSSVATPFTGGTAASAGSTGSAGSAAAAAPSSAAASRTVTGSAVDTAYGPVQVQLTVADGSITNLSVVRYPNSGGRDREINARALPILIQETLKAQSAQIDMVSGATYTSEGYLTSLQSALDRAGL